ncbi:MAG: heparinase II/III family protein [Candidatus Xenobia bacterium]
MLFSKRATRLEEILRKRDRERQAVTITDAELFGMIRSDDICLIQITPALRRRQYEAAGEALLEHWRDRYLPVFLFAPSSRQHHVSVLLSARQAAAASVEWAERITNHVFYSPYRGTISMGPYVDWFADFHGKSWFADHTSVLRQKIFVERIHESLGMPEPHATWEFNKHEHLVELGRAYWLTAEERYSCEFVIQLVDWIEKNPLGLGINWLDAGCVAQRVLNWIWALGFFIASEHVSASFLVRALKSLALHGAWLAQWLQGHDGRETRLSQLAVSTALGVLARYMPEFQFSRDWITLADAAHREALQAELGADGGHLDGSLDRQRMALELALTRVLVAGLNGEVLDVAPERKLIEDGLRCLAEMASPQGTFQPFGEGMTTRALPFGLPFTSDPKGVLALGAFLFGRGDVKTVVGDAPPLALLWLLGPAAAERWASLPATTPSENCRVFGQAGTAVVREKDFWLYFRTGGLAGHDDRFHVSMAVGGETVFTDLGTSELYPETRPGLSSSRAHNVVSIRHSTAIPDTVPQRPQIIRTMGRLLLQAPPRGYEVDLDAAAKSPSRKHFIAMGRGERTPQPVAEPHPRVVYQRQLLIDMSEKWVVFKDELTGSGEFEVDVLFYHPPGLDLVQRGDQGCVLWKKGAWLRIQPYLPGPFRWYWDRPTQAGAPPFYSPDGVGLQPVYALRYHAVVKLPAELYFWVYWDAGVAGSPGYDEVQALFGTVPARTR